MPFPKSQTPSGSGGATAGLRTLQFRKHVPESVNSKASPEAYPIATRERVRYLRMPRQNAACGPARRGSPWPPIHGSPADARSFRPVGENSAPMREKCCSWATLLDAVVDFDVRALGSAPCQGFKIVFKDVVD